MRGWIIIEASTHQYVDMKACPKCSTQYSDDTLSFCLQDGAGLLEAVQTDTPTVFHGETETFVRGEALGRVNIPVVDPDPTAWSSSQITHVRTLQPEKHRSNTVLAIGLTVVGMLLLFGVVGIAAFIFWRASEQPVVTNANNANGNGFPGGTTNTNVTALPTPQASPTPIVSSTRAMATPFPTGTIDSPPPTTFDDSAARTEVSQRVYGWKSSLESRDFNGYMGNYAPTLDYFTRRGMSSATVRADKARAFNLYNSMRVSVTNMSVSVGPTGDTATATFDKEWSFSGRDTSSGKVRSQLGFRLINGRWLITSERDLKLYYKR